MPLISYFFAYSFLWKNFLFFRMIFSATRPYVFICQALAPIPLGFAPYPLKIDTLESFKGWKSWLWISKWILGGASVCFSISSGADARAKMLCLFQDRCCATYIQHQHSSKVFHCGRRSLWWNCFANWFYLVVCLVNWQTLTHALFAGRIEWQWFSFGWKVIWMTPPRKKKHSSWWRLLLLCWTFMTCAEHLWEFSGRPPYPQIQCWRIK